VAPATGRDDARHLLFYAVGGVRTLRAVRCALAEFVTRGFESWATYFRPGRAWVEYMRLKFSFYRAFAGVAIIAPILLVFAAGTLPEGPERGALIVDGLGVVLAVLATALVLRAAYALGCSQTLKVAASEPNDGSSQATRLASMPSSCALTRHLMPYKAVRIEVLDDDGAPVIARAANGELEEPVVASGFIMWESPTLYLYTCWHVVTGIPLIEPVRLPGALHPQRRMKLRVSMQSSAMRDEHLVPVDENHSFEIDLYDTTADPPMPLWEQDERAEPDGNLALAKLAEPAWHDAVRIPLYVRPENLQELTLDDLWTNHIAPGDDLLVVGYPYGYRAAKVTPAPIALKRHVAAIAGEAAGQQILIDGGGAPGMSGGPVFCESADRLYLYGIYTGVVFPAAAEGVIPERTTALGTVCPLRLLLPTFKFAPPIFFNPGTLPLAAKTGSLSAAAQRLVTYG
jgi:Trypsin-like peptidase domain